MVLHSAVILKVFVLMLYAYKSAERLLSLWLGIIKSVDCSSSPQFAAEGG